jgi:hypothetical protein
MSQPPHQPTPEPTPASKHQSVRIPRTPLGHQIDEAAQIQRDMTQLLRQLEQSATGHPIKQPGTWRHHPSAWAKRHDLT